MKSESKTMWLVVSPKGQTSKAFDLKEDAMRWKDSLKCATYDKFQICSVEIEI